MTALGRVSCTGRRRRRQEVKATMSTNTSKLLVLALVCTGCKDKDTPVSNDSPSEVTKAQSSSNEGSSASSDDTERTPTSAEPPAEPPADPPRSTAAASVKGKPAAHLGFSLDKLAGWYSIEGRAVVPSWAAASDASPDDVRDDDLRTAWTCTPEGERPCALGLSFSEPVTVRAIRLYGAAGPDYNTYRAHPRVQEVRVHTDTGWVDATFKDGANHGYVLLDAPIESRTVAIEILGTHKGGKSQMVHLAELEVLGTAGPRRPPLDLDPSASAVVFETEAWKQKGDAHTIRLAFLEVARADGALQRLLRGTSLLGRKGDRFLLVEKLHGSSCSEHDGSYILLDQQTRMLFPLGTMGGAPGQVLRHDAGQGFAIRPPTESSGPFRAVVLDDGAVKIKYSPKQDDRAAKAQVDWGFASEVSEPRGGGHRLTQPPAECKVASLDDAGDAFEDEAFTPWALVECKLDETSAALVATDGSCGKQWSIAVVDEAGAVVHRQRQKTADGRGLWLARIDGAGLVVEASRADGASADLFGVSPEGITLLAKGAALALRTPSSCDPCDDRFAAELGESGVAVAAAQPSSAAVSETDSTDDELPSVDEPDDDAADDDDDL
jgi:hypothetical protein